MGTVVVVREDTDYHSCNYTIWVVGYCYICSSMVLCRSICAYVDILLCCARDLKILKLSHHAAPRGLQ
jgi:hypothetical protein